MQKVGKYIVSLENLEIGPQNFGREVAFRTTASIHELKCNFKVELGCGASAPLLPERTDLFQSKRKY